MEEFTGGKGALKNTIESIATADATSLNERFSEYGKSGAPPQAATILNQNLWESMQPHLEEQFGVSVDSLRKERETLAGASPEQLEEYKRKGELLKSHKNKLSEMVDVFGDKLSRTSRTTGVLLSSGALPQPKIDDLDELLDGPKTTAHDLSKPFQKSAGAESEGIKDSPRVMEVKRKIYDESTHLADSPMGEALRSPDAILALKQRIAPTFEKTGYGEIGIAEQTNNAQVCAMKHELEGGDISLAKMPEEGGEQVAVETGRIRGNRTLSQAIEVADSFQKYVKGEEEGKGWARDFVFGAFRASPMAHLLMKSMDLYGGKAPSMTGFDQFFGAAEHKIGGFDNFTDDDFASATKLLNSYGRSQEGAVTGEQLHNQILKSFDNLVTPDEANNELQNNALGNFEKLMSMVSSPEHRRRLAENLDDYGGKIMEAAAHLRKDDFAHNPPDEEKTKSMQDVLKKKFCPESDGGPQNLDNALSRASAEAMPDNVAASSKYAAGLNNMRINRNLTGLV